MPKTSPLHEMMLGWWEKEGVGELTSNTCNSLAMLARLVSGGVGIGVLPTCILREVIQKGSVVNYRQKTLFAPLHICAAYPKATRSEGIAALVDIARSVMLESRCFMPLDYEKA